MTINLLPEGMGLILMSKVAIAVFLSRDKGRSLFSYGERRSRFDEIWKCDRVLLSLRSAIAV